ncbi:hypothetical protein GW17_00007446 [Ensete ventricosum]|nr:hypothetical protein GW17_00007446 [Ensete ventricosum]
MLPVMCWRNGCTTYDGRRWSVDGGKERDIGEEVSETPRSTSRNGVRQCGGAVVVVAAAAAAAAKTSTSTKGIKKKL